MPWRRFLLCLVLSLLLDTAHTLWEWWTAENSDGFHNPTLARDSLARSLNASQDGIKLLEKAIADSRTKK